MAIEALPTDPLAYSPHDYASGIFPSADWARRAGVDEKAINRHNRMVNNVFHRARNGINDPLSQMLVIDALIRHRPGVRLRARYMTRHLRATKPYFIWDTQIIGRILGSLHDKSIVAYTPYRWLPIKASNDQTGTIYFLTRHPETYRWLWKVMMQLRQISEDTMLAEAQKGETAGRKANPLDLIDTSPVETEDLWTEYP
jgi:hypothetical protein